MPFSSHCWRRCARSCFHPATPGSSYGSTALWVPCLVSRLLAAGSLAARTAGLLAVIETPEAMEGYLLRAQGQDDAKRRDHRCIETVQEALQLSADRRRLA